MVWSTQGKTAMNTDFERVNRVLADTVHTLCKSTHVRLSTAQVRVKSVVIPCTYTDFHGITTDLRGLLQRANGVRTVWIWTLLTPSKSVFMAVFPCATWYWPVDFRGSLHAEMKRLQQVIKKQAEFLQRLRRALLGEKPVRDHTHQTSLDTMFFLNRLLFCVGNRKTA